MAALAKSQVDFALLQDLYAPHAAPMAHLAKQVTMSEQLKRLMADQAPAMTKVLGDEFAPELQPRTLDIQFEPLGRVSGAIGRSQLPFFEALLASDQVQKAAGRLMPEALRLFSNRTLCIEALNALATQAAAEIAVSEYPVDVLSVTFSVCCSGLHRRRRVETRLRLVSGQETLLDR